MSVPRPAPAVTAVTVPESPPHRRPQPESALVCWEVEAQVIGRPGTWVHCGITMHRDSAADVARSPELADWMYQRLLDMFEREAEGYDVGVPVWQVRPVGGR